MRGPCSKVESDFTCGTPEALVILFPRRRNCRTLQASASCMEFLADIRLQAFARRGF